MDDTLAELIMMNFAVWREKQPKVMTQDERWQKRYEEVVGFIEANQRNPSKYVVEEVRAVMI